jgi:predicted MFS family arabinose efflux permease
VSPLRLASAGIGVVGVTFGMARYGYGLLLPDIRASYGLSSSALGLIGASSYLAYMVASVVAGALSFRVGPRGMVVAGGALASAGMVVAGLSRGPAALVAGLLVAGFSAGLVFPPFSDVVGARVAEPRRERVLSAVSSGTGWGVALAAPIAIALGSGWRSAWLVFAAVAVVATAWAARVLPGAPGSSCEVPRLRLGWFVCPRAGPLLVSSFLIGLTSSVFWTFAVDLLVRQGSLSGTQSRSFLAIVGVASVAAAGSGDLLRRAGASRTFSAAVIAESAALVLLGLAPGSVVAAALAGVLFGVSYNIAVAVEVIWSSEVFADRPSAGLAAVMFVVAAGLLVGPPLAGALADAAGLDVVFLAAGAVLSLAVGLRPRTLGTKMPRAETTTGKV